MSLFFKPLGYLATVAAAMILAGCNSVATIQTANAPATTTDKPSTQSPPPKVKIPMPLDKAGYKVETGFEIPPPRKKYSRSAWHYYLGLRVPFEPGGVDVQAIMKKSPVPVRISLSRIVNGKETQAVLDRPPGRFHTPVESSDERETFISSWYYTQLSDTSPGTPAAPEHVFVFAGSRDALRPGTYRLQVETLKDLPELSGLTSFLTYEENPID